MLPSFRSVVVLELALLLVVVVVSVVVVVVVVLLLQIAGVALWSGVVGDGASRFPQRATEPAGGGNAHSDDHVKVKQKGETKFPAVPYGAQDREMCSGVVLPPDALSLVVNRLRCRRCPPGGEGGFPVDRSGPS